MSSPITKTGALLTTAFLVLVGVCAFALYSLNQVQDMTAWVSHTNDVLDQVDELNTNLWSAESAVRGFAITGNEEFLRPYTPALNKIHMAWQELERLTRDNPQVNKQIPELKLCLEAKLAWQENVLAASREQGTVPAETMIRTGKGKLLMDQALEKISAVKLEEERLLLTRQSAQQQRTEQTYRALAIMGGVSGIILLLAYSVIRQHERRRNRAEERRQTAVLERGLAEKAARDKAEDLDRFFELSPDLMCIIDRSGYFRRLNLAWKTVLGYNLDELEGKQTILFVHPDDLTATQTAMQELNAGRKLINFVNRYRCKDGTYRRIEWQAAPYQNRLVFSIARDITERQERENPPLETAAVLGGSKPE